MENLEKRKIVLYGELCDVLEEYYSCGDEPLIEKAFSMIMCKSEEKNNKMDHSTIMHSLQMAISFAKKKLRKEMIIAALLCNIMGDEITNRKIKDIFGKDVLACVQELSRMEGLD